MKQLLFIALAGLAIGAVARAPLSAAPIGTQQVIPSGAPTVSASPSAAASGSFQAVR